MRSKIIKEEAAKCPLCGQKKDERAKMCRTCRKQSTDPNYISEKSCTRCLKILPLSEFGKRRGRAVSCCNDCMKVYRQNSYYKYKDSPNKRLTEEERGLNREISLIKVRLRQLGIQEEYLNYFVGFGILQKECQICQIPKDELPRRLSIDHCHNTGKIRGFICSQCNAALGFVQDNIKILEKLIKYLEFNGAIAQPTERDKNIKLIIPTDAAIYDKPSICSCGTKKQVQALRCNKCMRDNFRKHWPTKEILSELYPKHNMKYIGKIFGYSGTTIKKWLIFYDLWIKP